MKSTLNTVAAYHLDRRKTRSGFDRAAQTYDEAALLQREIGQRLLSVFDYVNISPKRMLDLGCGTGVMTQALRERYVEADLIALDLAFAMTQFTQQRLATGQHQAPINTLCADAQALPLISGCADLVLSNLMLQWCNDLSLAFTECRRILAPNGLFVFSTFGPDTLKELRSSWSAVDGYTHTSRFVDMHEIGDALLQTGFKSPVVTREIITLTYPTVQGLLSDLKAIGANNATAGRAKGLMGKTRLQAFFQAYESFRQTDDLYPATYEVIYAHAWTGNVPQETPTMPLRFIPTATD